MLPSSPRSSSTPPPPALSSSPLVAPALMFASSIKRSDGAVEPRTGFVAERSAVPCRPWKEPRASSPCILPSERDVTHPAVLGLVYSASSAIWVAQTLPQHTHLPTCPPATALHRQGVFPTARAHVVVAGTSPRRLQLAEDPSLADWVCYASTAAVMEGTQRQHPRPPPLQQTDGCVRARFPGRCDFSMQRTHTKPHGMAGEAKDYS